MSDLDKYIVQFVRPGGSIWIFRRMCLQKNPAASKGTVDIRPAMGVWLPMNKSYTINTYFNRPNVGCNIHYSQNRLVTVREALRLQTFPTATSLCRQVQGRHKSVGNAVPPMLARAFAKQQGLPIMKGRRRLCLYGWTIQRMK